MVCEHCLAGCDELHVQEIAKFLPLESLIARCTCAGFDLWS